MFGYQIYQCDHGMPSILKSDMGQKIGVAKKAFEWNGKSRTI
jgi:hypothetical protein